MPPTGVVRCRSISRVYLSSGEEPIGGKSWRREGEEPRLMSWRKTQEDSALPQSHRPPIPARKPSAAGDGAPNRPPKPNRSNNNTDDEDCRKDKDSNNSDSSIWYEYGCV